MWAIFFPGGRFGLSPKSMALHFLCNKTLDAPQQLAWGWLFNDEEKIPEWPSS
jgi:hypothetical protein